MDDMEGLSKIGIEAMCILSSATNRIRYDEWCNKVRVKFDDIKFDKIKKELKRLIKKDWRVPVVEEGKDPLYCYLELLL